MQFHFKHSFYAFRQSTVCIAHIYWTIYFSWSSIKCAALYIFILFLHLTCISIVIVVILTNQYICVYFFIWKSHIRIHCSFSLLFLQKWLNKNAVTRKKNLYTNKSSGTWHLNKIPFQNVCILTIFIDRYGKFLIKIVCTPTKNGIK